MLPSWLAGVAVEYTDCRGLKKKQPVHDAKQAESEIPVMLELWGIQRTPSLPFLPGPLWLGVVAPDRVLSMG